MADGRGRMPTRKQEGTSSRLTARLSICCWAGEFTISGAATGRKPPKSPMADSINAATKYVATHRPKSLEWGPAEDLGADIVEGIRRTKAKSGPQLIVWGSSTLTPVLLEHGLADEVMLLVFPVLLGTGKRIFSEGTPPRELALVSTKAVGSGVIISTYKPSGPLRTSSYHDARK